MTDREPLWGERMDRNSVTRLSEGQIDRRTFLTMAASMAAGLATVGVTGCGGQLASDNGGNKGRIAFGQPDRGADVYPPLLAGAKEEAAKRGYEVVESFSDGKVDKQVQEINTWIAQGIDAMTVLPLDPKAIGPLVEKAQAEDIPFVAYSTPLPGADGLVTFDHAQGADLVGEAVGRWINETLDGEAEVALLNFPQVETGRVRINNAEKKMLEVAPNAKVVARQKAILAPEALEASQSILQAHPNVNVFICIADDGCLGARQAFLDTGRPPESVFITGYDGSKQVMQRIIQGNDPIKATAALNLKEIGRQAIGVPANILADEKPTTYNAPYMLVTPETKDLANRLIDNYGA